MLKKIANFLEKPYYYKQSRSYRLAISFGLSLFITFFIIHFRPLDINNLSSDIYLFAISTGVICLFHFLFFYFVVIKLFPSFFHPERWTIGKQNLTVFIITFLISIFLWIYHHYFSPDKLLINISYLKIVKLVLGIGLIPLTVYFFVDEKYGKYKRNLISKEVMKESKASTSIKNKKIIENEKVKIFALNEKDFVEINIKQLIYITSHANYTSFFIIENDIVKEVILRIQLGSVEDILKDFDSILRCHKSYIVNTSYITDISGNARGFYFHLDEFSIDIPVSRKFNKKDLLKIISN